MTQFAVVEPMIPGPLHAKVTPGSALEHICAEVRVQVRLTPVPQERLGRVTSCVTIMKQVWVQPLEVLVAVTE